MSFVIKEKPDIFIFKIENYKHKYLDNLSEAIDEEISDDNFKWFIDVLKYEIKEENDDFIMRVLDILGNYLNSPARRETIKSIFSEYLSLEGVRLGTHGIVISCLANESEEITNWAKDFLKESFNLENDISDYLVEVINNNPNYFVGSKALEVLGKMSTKDPKIYHSLLEIADELSKYKNESGKALTFQDFYYEKMKAVVADCIFVSATQSRFTLKQAIKSIEKLNESIEYDISLSRDNIKSILNDLKLKDKKIIFLKGKESDDLRAYAGGGDRELECENDIDEEYKIQITIYDRNNAVFTCGKISTSELILPDSLDLVVLFGEGMPKTSEVIRLRKIRDTLKGSINNLNIPEKLFNDAESAKDIINHLQKF